MLKSSKENLPLDFYLNDDVLRARHLKNTSVNQANLFFPFFEEIVDYDPKNPKKTQRRIFESKLSDYLEPEKQYLKELHDEIRSYNEKNPKSKLNTQAYFQDYDLLRLHQATTYNVPKTIKLIKERIEWMEENLPPKLTNKVLEILNCGFVYVHGRDSKFRPIIVLVMENYKKNEDLYTYDEWLQATVYFMEYVVNDLLIPGQVENWIVITDFTGVSFFFLPSTVKKMMVVLQSNWRCRLRVSYLLNTSSIVRGLWKIAKAFLNEATVQKVQFLDSSNKNDIFSQINEHQIEEKFGGKAPNTIPGMHQLFPPVFPSNNFLKPGQIESESGIISEESYKEMYDNNKLAKCGDYFLKKWKKEDEEKEAAKNFVKNEQKEDIPKSKNKLQENTSENLGENNLAPCQSDNLVDIKAIDMKLEEDTSTLCEKKIGAIKGNVLQKSTPKVMRFFNNKSNHRSPQAQAIDSTPDIITSYASTKNFSKTRSKSLTLKANTSEKSENKLEAFSGTNTSKSEKDYKIDIEKMTAQNDKKEVKNDCIIY
jgi:hypothetical protein